MTAESSAQGERFAIRLGAAAIWFRNGQPSRVGRIERATAYDRQAAEAKAAELGRHGAPWTIEALPTAGDAA